MKKILLFIFCVGASAFVISLLAVETASAVPYPPFPGMCDMKFTDRGGETHSANAWCTSCPDGPYDFYFEGDHYQFGCVKNGGACSCDRNNTFYESCPGGGTNWDCGKGSGCAWGSCEQAPPGDDGTPEPSNGASPPGEAKPSDGKGWTGKLEPPIEAKSFEELIDGIINFVFWIGVAVAPIMILIAGVMYMTAGGDTIKIGKAKNLILYTVIGFTIIMFARGLIALLESILGK